MKFYLLRFWVVLVKPKTTQFPRNTTAYIYDVANRLVTVKYNGTVQMQYLYNTSGLRNKMGAKYVIYDGAVIVAEYDATNHKYLAIYGYGVGLVNRRDSAGIVQIYMFNAHGDVLSTVDAAGPNAGKYSHKYTYDAFGNESGIDVDDTNPFRYCGEWWDKQTKRLYLRARDYDSAPGRFTSEDPIKDGLNWYTYCENNPVNAIDPCGLRSYIFYLPEWVEDANAQKQALIDIGISEDEIILIEITSKEALTNGWNGMGIIRDENGKVVDEVDIDYVIINTHASKNFLSEGPINGWELSTKEIGYLNEKKINKMLILTGCNAGHMDFKDANPAAAFSKRVMNAPVIASDGAVTTKSFEGYKRSTNDDFFRDFLKEIDQNYKRDIVGWVQYQYNNLRVTAICLNTIFLSIASLAKGPIPYLGSDPFQYKWHGSPYITYAGIGI